MKITVKMLADSVNAHTGARLCTLVVRQPRYIHAEFMTHRVFSRNASSSRAIPISKQIDAVESDPVYPIEWGQNKPGMQAGEALGRVAQTEAENAWGLALIHAVEAARKLKDLGVHKQIVNRLLEPFSYITVIVSATDWQNFFDLRISPLAQPEIQEVAKQIKAAMDASNPRHLKLNEYHAPYLTDNEMFTLAPEQGMMVSAARCARVSYLNHDGLLPDVDKDLSLAERLMADKHASVFEHQAFPTALTMRVRNFQDWHQHRDLLGL